MSLDQLVENARTGSREAVEQVVEAVQDDIYRLAMRMLWHPHDAEDATQEILIRIITNLASFRGDSAFSTWVYRIASNHLLTARKRRMEQRPISFEEFGADLVEGLSDAPLDEYTMAEQRLLVEEVKIGCTQAMLLCLDRDHRLSYILGEIMELASDEGAAILEITSAAFRKRLSRSRERVREFMSGHCGLVNSNAACRCHRRVRRAVELGRVDPQNPLFAQHSSQPGQGKIEERIVELDELRRAAAIQKASPKYSAPSALLDSIVSLLSSSKFRVLDE